MDQDDRKAGEEIVRADDHITPGAETGGPEGAEPETFELELDGSTHTLPVALKGAFLRHADYTRKTQELAHQRRMLEAERASVAEQAHAAAGALSDRAHLAALDQHLADLSGVDWEALAQHDPQTAQALWARLQQTSDLRQHFSRAVAHHEAHRRLQSDREAVEAMAETGRVLAREIPGWSPELASKLCDFAMAQGVTPEELKATSDPRIWKVLHKALQAESGGRGEAAAKAQSLRPAVSVTGAAGSTAGVRDELGTKDWMRRRNDQVRNGR